MWKQTSSNFQLSPFLIRLLPSPLYDKRKIHLPLVGKVIKLSVIANK